MWRIAGWSVAACLLLLPLIAMTFTGKLGWTGFDFMVAGGLLALIGGAAGRFCAAA